MADTIAVLDEGRVVQHADIDALYRRPASITVARLLGGFSELAGTPVEGGYDCHLGFVPAPAPRAGEPTVVLVRQEALQVVDEHGPHAAASGLVVGSTRAGTRQVAKVELDAAAGAGPTASVLVELPPGVAPPVGHRVGVRVTGTLVHVPKPSADLESRADVDRSGEGAVDGALVRDRQ